MSSSFDDFRKQVLDISKDFAEEELDKVVRVFSLQALRGVVLRSPVGNPDLWKAKAPKGYVGGHFRANWQVSVGELIPVTTEAIDAGGASTISAGTQQLHKIRGNPFTVVWIHNSLPYAVALEEGHSTQAPGPAAIVGRTMQELRSFGGS